MQQQMPWHPEDMVKWAIFWTVVVQMVLQSSKIAPGEGITSLHPQKFPLFCFFYQFMRFDPPCLVDSHGFIVEVWPVWLARLGLGISHWKRPDKTIKSKFLDNSQIAGVTTRLCRLLPNSQNCETVHWFDWQLKYTKFWLPPMNLTFSCFNFILCFFCHHKCKNSINSWF